MISSELNFMSGLWRTPLMEAVGVALLHFIWQGFLVGLMVRITLAAQQTHTANARYLTCLIGMAVMMALPALTVYAIMLDLQSALPSTVTTIVLISSPVSAPNWSLPFLPWLTCGWIAGACTLQLRMIGHWLRAEMLKRTGLQIASRECRRHFSELQGRMEIKAPVRIFESAQIAVPSVIGWLRPVVLVPIGLAERLTPIQLRSVIAHELAHIGRHDYIVNLAQSVFESVLFFHPITWWLSKRLRMEREFCCDDTAIAVCESRLQYAQALSALENVRGIKEQTVLAANGGSLMKRLTRILAGERAGSNDLSKLLLPVSMLLVMMVAAVAIGVGCSSEATDDLGGVQQQSSPTTPVVQSASGEQPCCEIITDYIDIEACLAHCESLDVEKIREMAGDFVSTGGELVELKKGNCVIALYNPEGGAQGECALELVTNLEALGKECKDMSEEEWKTFLKYHVQSCCPEGTAEIHVKKLDENGDPLLVTIKKIQIDDVPENDGD
jgi:beta-lactamase regulating signal transducer with metallopeptidase domain